MRTKPEDSGEDLRGQDAWFEVRRTSDACVCRVPQRLKPSSAGEEEKL